MAPRQGLTDKQSAFVQEYMIDLNATQAAARAGYRDPNIGRQLITKNNVATAISSEMAERSARTEITADNVLLSILDIRELAIKSDKLSDALKANELLGKHLKLWTDKQEVKHEGDIVLRISHEDANL